MSSPFTWFVLLALACIAGPYLLDVRPRTRVQWTWLAITIAFLAWLLPMMGSVRSR